MRIALFEPDIPQNTGSLIRLSACTGVELHIIEPCGFPFDDKRLRRASLDYYDLARITRHRSWPKFEAWRQEERCRLLLLTTRADMEYTQCTFTKQDILLMGRESLGVPEDVHRAADMRLKIPMQDGARSLNVALAASMVLGEGLRQTR